jgi:hypothetical protein
MTTCPRAELSLAGERALHRGDVATRCAVTSADCCRLGCMATRVAMGIQSASGR